jgi:hypothetical protein
MILSMGAIFWFVPLKLRTLFKGYGFDLLRSLVRSLGLSQLLKYINVRICHAYHPVSIESLKQIQRRDGQLFHVKSAVSHDHIQGARCLPSDSTLSLMDFHQTTERMILEFFDSDFCFHGNHLCDPYLNVLGEKLPPQVKKEQLHVFYRFFAFPRKLRGTVAYLSDPDTRNYYHWMCRVLPLVKSYRDFCQFHKIDYFYTGSSPLLPFHQETLEKLGIPQEKVIRDDCQADRIVFGLYNRSVDFGDAISKEAYTFSRNLFFRSDYLNLAQRSKRYYIKRGGTNRRRVLNEDQVIQFLSQYGFEPLIMDGKNIDEQASIFAEAEAIVAPHGAALTNLLFIQPGTVVIELFPYGYVNNCFFVLASHGNANYFYLRGEPIRSDRALKRLKWYQLRDLDLEIDIKKLSSLLTMASL